MKHKVILDYIQSQSIVSKKMINTLSINGDKNKPDYNIKSGLLLFIRFIFLFVINSR